jgi:predicted membrane-bound mannosyltransferase
MKFLGKQKTILIGTFIALLALLVRIWDLGARSIWLDEAVEYWTASVPLQSIPKTVIQTFQPPLYSGLLHVWILFGTSEIWLRLLSVLLSLSALLGLFLLARKLIGIRGALVSSALFAVLPTSVRYAQDVGEYALLEATLIWALFLLSLTLSEEHFHLWLLFGIAASISIYSHYGAIIPLMGIGFALLVKALRKREARTITGLASATAVSLILCLPLFLYFLPAQRARMSTSSHALPFQGVHNEVVILLDAARDTLTFPIMGWSFTSLKEIYTWIGLAIFVTLALILLLSRSDSRFKRSIVWLLAAFSCYYIFVRTGLYSFGRFGFRHVLILVPLIILAISAIIERLFQSSKSRVAFMLLAITITVEVISLPNKSLSDVTRKGMAWPETENIAPIIDYWSSNSDPGDVTYVYYGASPAFRYYLNRTDPDPEIQPNWYFNCMVEYKKGVCSEKRIFFGEWYRGESVEAIKESIEQTLPPDTEVLWAVFSHQASTDEERTLSALTDLFERQEHFRVDGASIYQLIRIH